jgi:peroxiredoxin
MRWWLRILMLVWVGASGVACAAPTTGLRPIASSAEEIQPLLLGSPLPEASLRRLDGSDVSLRELLAGQPALLVFYRGGWCPYCNLQLQGLRLIRERVEALGFRMIALSPDRPEALRATLDQTPLDYTLVSDARAEAMRGFGIAFRVDDATAALYRGYGIDLEAASGESHRALPVPAVFLLDADGRLQFSYVHPDYTVRLPEAVILAAAEALQAGRQKLDPSRGKAEP